MFLSDHMFDGNRRFPAKDITTQIRRRDRNKGKGGYRRREIKR